MDRSGRSSSRRRSRTALQRLVRRARPDHLRGQRGPRTPTATELYQPHLTAPEFQRGTVIPSTPFLKLTAGVDYTWNKYLYSNLQYVYGFIDEFGAGQQCYARPTRRRSFDDYRCEARIGHYLVVGSDLKLFSDQLLIRFFGAFKVPQSG